jgi:membrane associated rhomboid family serine protease
MLFFQPVGKHRFSTPLAVYALIAVSTLAYAFTALDSENIIKSFGLVPARFSFIDSVISTFLHAGIFHLIGNMIFLYMFGPGVEDVVGPFMFVLLYLILAVISDSCYAWMNLQSTLPVVGASGAVSGILGVFLVFFPNVKVNLFLAADSEASASGPFLMNAFWAIGFWFAGQLLWAILALALPTHVAYAAHVGGLIGGVILGLLLKAAGFLDSFHARVRRTRGSSKPTVYCPACALPIAPTEFGRYRCPNCASEFTFDVKRGYRLLQ